MSRSVLMLILLISSLFSCLTIRQSKISELSNNNFYDSKIDTIGYNIKKVDLYISNSRVDWGELVEFCTKKKESLTHETTYLLIVFDNKRSAKYPIYDLAETSNLEDYSNLYNIDKKLQKHIRAIYIYNKIAKFSKLEYFDKNMHKSGPVEINI